MGTSEHVRCNVYRQPGTGRLDTLLANAGPHRVVLWKPRQSRLVVTKDPRRYGYAGRHADAYTGVRHG